MRSGSIEGESVGDDRPVEHAQASPARRIPASLRQPKERALLQLEPLDDEPLALGALEVGSGEPRLEQAERHGGQEVGQEAHALTASCW